MPSSQDENNMDTAASSAAAAAFNNRGAYHLIHNSYKEAVDSFRKSIAITKQCLNQVNHHHPTLQHQLDSALERRDEDSCNFECSFLDMDDNTQAARQNLPTVDSSFVSKHLMIISHLEHQDDSVHYLSKVALTAIYNLAIANHLYGLQSQSRRDLERALSYYEISYRLQIGESPYAHPTYIMSILNNVATIYKQFNDQERSNVFFEQLCIAMTHARDNRRDHDWDGYWSNIICSRMKKARTAPAA